MIPEPAALLEGLAGRWRIARAIEDRLAGDAGRFEGEAVFSRGEGGLLYHETGTLSLPGRPALRAERRYLWSVEAREVVVRFADGRAFHRFDPTAGAAARHDCAPDVYEVAYDFSGWPRWRAVWDVSGPRKAYTMTSDYTRAG